MIKRIKSGGIYEDMIGYCRAVVAGGFVHVAGTTAQGTDISDDVGEQCEAALRTIKAALEGAGSDLAHVVRVTYYMQKASEFELCWPLLAEVFGPNPPAATMIECNLIDPKYKIEIEVTAVLREEAGQ